MLLTLIMLAAAEPQAAIVDAKTGDVEQVIIWDGVTPWPSLKDAKAMQDAGKAMVQLPAGAAVGRDWVYDAKTKTFDKSAAMKAAGAKAASDLAAAKLMCQADNKVRVDCALVLTAP